MAKTATTDGARRAERIAAAAPRAARLARRLPLLRRATGELLYVGKARSIRKRVASHFSGGESRAHLAGRPHRRASSPPTRPRRCSPSRASSSATGRASTSACATTSPTPTSRQPRRGLPAGLLHPREAPLRPRLLRPLLQRQAGAGDARPARQAVPVPHLRGRRAGPPLRQPLPRLLHQALRGALRRLRQPRGVPPQHRRDRRLPLRPLPPGRGRRAGEDGGGGGGAGIRARGDPPRPPGGDPARCSSASGSPAARSAPPT